jgi:hypothetical protein
MPEVSEIDKCRAKRKVAKASVTRNMNRVRQLISTDGMFRKSDSLPRVKKFVRKPVILRKHWKSLIYPASIETGGSW